MWRPKMNIKKILQPFIYEIVLKRVKKEKKITIQKNFYRYNEPLKTKQGTNFAYKKKNCELCNLFIFLIKTFYRKIWKIDLRYNIKSILYSNEYE